MLSDGDFGRLAELTGSHFLKICALHVEYAIGTQFDFCGLGSIGLVFEPHLSGRAPRDCDNTLVWVEAPFVVGCGVQSLMVADGQMCGCDLQWSPMPWGLWVLEGSR